MWVKVQRCMGPNGERLKRAEWSAPVEGDLTVGMGKLYFVSTLELPDADRRHQVLYPLGDVRVQTFEDGLLVIGYAIVTETPTREVRQAWYAVPAARP